MRRLFLKWLVVVGCSSTMVPGCGPDLPSTRPGRASIPEPEPAQTLFLIMPGTADLEAEGWALVAQREANGERVIFRSLGPAPDVASVDGPGMVRRAIADGASALIVASSDAPGLPEALTEAESKKIPVVVLGRPIPAPPGSPPFTTVAPKSFEASAEQLVRAALDDAKKAGRPADGTAVLLAGRAVDSFEGDRAAALKAAAEKAGLKVRTVEFDPPPNPATFASTVKAVLDSPEVTILLAADDPAMSLAARVRKEVWPRLKVFAAGYVSQRSASTFGVFGSESAFVEYRSEELGRLAVDAALGRLRGEDAGRRVELDPRFRRGLASDPQIVDESPTIVRGLEMPKAAKEPAKKP